MKSPENHRAGYIGKMVGELAEIARSDGLELLSHLLDMAKLEADSGPARNAQMPIADRSDIWLDASYLRELAHRCVRHARDCSHLATSHQLEAIGIELMQKAAELDELHQFGHGDASVVDATSATTTREK